MPMCPEESASKNGQNGAGISRRNVDGLMMIVELAYNSYVMGLNESEIPVSDSGDGFFDKPELDGPSSDDETYSVFNYSDEDDEDEAPPVFRCSFCDFEIHVSKHHSRLEEVHSNNPKIKVCPVCDGELGEDTKVLSSSRKRSWRSEKSRIWAGNSEMFGRKLAAWETGSIRELMLDSLLSQFMRNMSNEDSINIASDISNAKSLWTDAPGVGDEKAREEGKHRASFLQEMVFSTML